MDTHIFLRSRLRTRRHHCKYNSGIRGWACIICCAVNASDLKTVHSGNELVKFADDTDLVVAASNVHTCIEELDNIKAWAERNNLKLNEPKSVEIVFRNPRSKTSSQINPPPTPMGIVRMKEIKTLGVTISDTFSVKTHENNIISSCGQALYAMKILKSQGLMIESLQIIFQVPIHNSVKTAVRIPGMVRICQRKRN